MLLLIVWVETVLRQLLKAKPLEHSIFQIQCSTKQHSCFVCAIIPFDTSTRCFISFVNPSCIYRLSWDVDTFASLGHIFVTEAVKTLLQSVVVSCTKTEISIVLREIAHLNNIIVFLTCRGHNISFSGNKMWPNLF